MSEKNDGLLMLLKKRKKDSLSHCGMPHIFSSHVFHMFKESFFLGFLLSFLDFFRVQELCAQMVSVYTLTMKKQYIQRIIQVDKGQLGPVPNRILVLTVFLCFSVLMQGICDVALKLLSYLEVVPYLPWRTDFLFLTAISVLMGYRTFVGMRRQKFDVTRNSIELGFLVELALVIGDSEFMYRHMLEMPHIIPMRLPFVMFTLVNIAILLYTYQELRLRRWPHLRRQNA